MFVPPPPWAVTPSLPPGPRVSGITASGPASPINPSPPAIGNKVGPSTSPPEAKGMRRPPQKTFPSAEAALKPLNPPLPKSIPFPPQMFPPDEDEPTQLNPPDEGS